MVACFLMFPGSALLPCSHQDIFVCVWCSSEKLSSVWATAWKGGLAVQFWDVERLDYSSPADSVLGPLDLTHSSVGETSHSLLLFSNWPTELSSDYLLALCRPPALMPILPSATSSGADTKAPGRSVADGGGQPTLMFGIPGFMVSAAHGCRVLVDLFPWDGLGDSKTMLLTPSFCNSTPSFNILILQWRPCDFQFPKEELLLPSPVRTLGQMRLSESPLSYMAPHVCICSVHVLKKSKQNNITSSRVEEHRATTRGEINLWACGESGKTCIFALLLFFLLVSTLLNTYNMESPICPPPQQKNWSVFSFLHLSSWQSFFLTAQATNI